MFPYVQKSQHSLVGGRMRAASRASGTLGLSHPAIRDLPLARSHANAARPVPRRQTFASVEYGKRRKPSSGLVRFAGCIF
jgi:hypothetical protein